MKTSDISKLLKDVQSGMIDVKTALARLRFLPFEDMTFAHIDHHRHLRHGMPEVIYCEGKTMEQVVGIARRMLKAGSDILATRASGNTIFISSSIFSVPNPLVTSPDEWQLPHLPGTPAEYPQ